MLFRSYEPELESVLPRLRYPLIVQPKYDGFRVQKTRNGKLETRSGKRIYNHHLRRVLNNVIPEGAEGEVTYGSSFQKLQELVSARDVELVDGKLRVTLFDYAVNLSTPYRERYEVLQRLQLVHSCTEVVSSKLVYTSSDVLNCFSEEIQQSYPRGEGIILRDPNGLRLNKRSTLREQLLIAVKRREEAVS